MATVIVGLLLLGIVLLACWYVRSKAKQGGCSGCGGSCCGCSGACHTQSRSADKSPKG